MTEFPLKSFLGELSANDGISITIADFERIAVIFSTQSKWTFNQMRNVLLAVLAHSEEEAEIFRLRFDRFFDKELQKESAVSQEQIDEFINQLKANTEEFKRKKDAEAVAQTTIGSDSEASPNKLAIGGNPKLTNTEPKKEPQTFRRKILTLDNSRLNPILKLIGLSIIAVILLIGVIVFCFYNESKITKITNINTVPSVTPITQTSISNSNINSTDNPSRNGTDFQINNNTSVNSSGNNKQIPRPDDWRKGAEFYILFFSVTLIIPVIITISLRWLPSWLVEVLKNFDLTTNDLENEMPPEYNSETPQFFRLSKIGGTPLPILDEATLDELALLLEYISSEHLTKRLNIASSVRASSQSAGMFVLHFQRKKEPFTIYLLEDEYAEPRAWNFLAQELYNGLLSRGISVRYGKFFNTLKSFEMNDGTTLWFEDIENIHAEAFFFFFSDAKRLSAKFDGFALQSFARSSAVIWFDLREKIFWDESARLINRFKIPLFQASKEGLEKAVRYLNNLTETEKKDNKNDFKPYKFVSSIKRVPSNEYKTQLADPDVIRWAQACAMIQPVSIGMADALRQKFAPKITPEKIERLFRLPDTTWNVAGIKFSLPMLSILHNDFKVSWTEKEQTQILNFILSEISKVEPAETNSLEYMTWKWAFEKVNLELDPDNALESFEKLSKTPLGDQIRSDFAKLSLPDNSKIGTDEDSVTIKLRLMPKTIHGLLTFRKLANKDINLERLSTVEKLSLLLYKTKNVIRLLLFESNRYNFLRTGLVKLVNKFDRKENKPEINPFTDFTLDDETHISKNGEFSLSSKKERIIEVRQLNTRIQSEDGLIKAADNVSFQMFAGEVLGIVGESGCGKSTILLSLLGLIREPGKIVSGEAIFNRRNILLATDKEMRDIRGNDISMIFQDPVTSLNPFLTVGEQIVEVFQLHYGYKDEKAYDETVKIMKAVAIPDAEHRIGQYPHQLSGGMCQRVMIAMALACKPKLLLADEPTSALDSINQVQIIELLKDLREKFNTAILFVTHDLSLLAGFADRVCVMYAGKIVEIADVREIFRNPRHPYTIQLMKSIPGWSESNRFEDEYSVFGESQTLDPITLSKGCHYAPNCKYRTPICTSKEIPMYRVKDKTDVRCVLFS